MARDKMTENYDNSRKEEWIEERGEVFGRLNYFAENKGNAVVEGLGDYLTAEAFEPGYEPNYEETDDIIDRAAEGWKLFLSTPAMLPTIAGGSLLGIMLLPGPVWPFNPNKEPLATQAYEEVTEEIEVRYNEREYTPEAGTRTPDNR